MIAAICMPLTTVETENGEQEVQGRAKGLSFLVPLCLILVGFSTALVCIGYDPGKKRVKGPVISRAATTPGHRWISQRPTESSYSQREIRYRLARYILRTIYHLWFNPVIAFLIQIMLAVLSTILVLSQKFSVATNPALFCGLQNSGENAWGFGQTLSIAMLLLPAMSACQTYLEGRQDIREGITRTKD